MGEMADMHDGYDGDDNGLVNHAEIREIDWVTKSGVTQAARTILSRNLRSVRSQSYRAGSATCSALNPE